MHKWFSNLSISSNVIVALNVEQSTKISSINQGALSIVSFCIQRNCNLVVSSFRIKTVS